MTDNERDLLLEVAIVLHRSMPGLRTIKIRDLADIVQKEHYDRLRAEEEADGLMNDVDPLGQG